MKIKWKRTVIALSVIGLINVASPTFAETSISVPSSPIIVSSLTKAHYNSERIYLLKLLRVNYASQLKQSHTPSDRSKLTTLYNSEVSYLKSEQWFNDMVDIANGAVNVAGVDAQNMGQKLADIASNFLDFGSRSRSNKIRVVSGVIVFDKMGKARSLVKAKLIISQGPGATKSKMKLALNSTIYSANFGFGHSKPWCVVISNNNSDVGLPLALGSLSSNFIVHTYAKYNNFGLISLRVGGVAPICINGL